MSENRHSSTSLSHDELKSALYSHIRDKGVLRTLKGQLRTELLHSAPAVMPKLAAAPSSSSSSSYHSQNAAGDASSAASGAACDAVCDSLVENYLRARQLPATRTVFLGESGVAAGNRVSDSDLSAMLHLRTASDNAVAATTGTASELVPAGQQHQQRGAVLSDLIRSHLHGGSSSSGKRDAVSDCGVQVHISGKKGQNTTAAECNGIASSQYESIEYKLALVDQSFIRSAQVQEGSERAQSELRYSKMREEVRAECTREARHELEVWKEQEGAAIRREERARAAQQMGEKLREMADVEHRMMRKAADDVEAIEALKRQSDRQLLQRQEECNDLKKAAHLRQQAQKVAERETERVQGRLHEAQAQADKLAAELEFLKHTMELGRQAEQRRTELKDMEIAGLMAQLHDQQQRMSQLRFDSRTLAAECAHTLDEAARSAIHQQQLQAKDKLVAASAPPAPVPVQYHHAAAAAADAAAAAPPQPHQQHRSQSQSQSHHVDPAASSISTMSQSRSNKKHQDPAAATAAAAAVAASKSPSISPTPSVRSSRTPIREEPKQNQQQLQPQEQAEKKERGKTTPPPAPAPAAASRDSPLSINTSASTSISTAVTASTTVEENRAAEASAAAAAAASDTEQEEKMKKQREQEAEDAAAAALEKKLQEIQSKIDDLFQTQTEQRGDLIEDEEMERTELSEKQQDECDIAKDEEKRRAQLAEEKLQKEQQAAAEQERKSQLEAEKKRIRVHVAQCESDAEKELEEIYQSWLTNCNSAMWTRDHNIMLQRAKEAKGGDDDEGDSSGGYPPAPRPRTPDTWSDPGEKDVNIFGSDDAEDDW